MKLVSRYLLRHLGRPWVYVMAGFSLVAILVDLFGNFVDFMDAGTPLADVVAQLRTVANIGRFDPRDPRRQPATEEPST